MSAPLVPTVQLTERWLTDGRLTDYSEAEVPEPSRLRSGASELGPITRRGWSRLGIAVGLATVRVTGMVFREVLPNSRR